MRATLSGIPTGRSPRILFFSGVPVRSVTELHLALFIVVEPDVEVTDIEPAKGSLPSAGVPRKFEERVPSPRALGV